MTARTKLRLTEAYRNTFAGNGNREDADLVLRDLAKTSGFYMVTPATAPDNVRSYSEGRRAVFARIQGHIRMTPEEIAALETAVRRDVLTQTEDDI